VAQALPEPLDPPRACVRAHLCFVSHARCLGRLTRPGGGARSRAAGRGAAAVTQTSPAESPPPRACRCDRPRAPRGCATCKGRAGARRHCTLRPVCCLPGCACAAATSAPAARQPRRARGGARGQAPCAVHANARPAATRPAFPPAPGARGPCAPGPGPTGALRTGALAHWRTALPLGAGRRQNPRRLRAPPRSPVNVGRAAFDPQPAGLCSARRARGPSWPLPRTQATVTHSGKGRRRAPATARCGARGPGPARPPTAARRAIRQGRARSMGGPRIGPTHSSNPHTRGRVVKAPNRGDQRTPCTMASMQRAQFAAGNAGNATRLAAAPVVSRGRNHPRSALSRPLGPAPRRAPLPSCRL
jgi:hypothetical protein